MDLKMLSFLGVNRHIKKGWRRLPHTFGGVGLLDLTVEQHICRINLFCQHYGSASIIGLKLTASLHWLQMQLGCPGNPLLMDYSGWGHLATRSWIKSFWEGISNFPGDLFIQFSGISPQRVNDQSLMDITFSAGLRGQALSSFNRCRCACNLFFLSDIVTASGAAIEDWVSNGSHVIIESKLDFPPEHPTDQDWHIWKIFWQVTYTNKQPLGDWIHVPHFNWTWWYNAQTDTIYRSLRSEWQVYERLSQRTRMTSGYVCTSTTADCPPCLPVSIKQGSALADK